jgi:hypothetical protein
MKRLYFIPILLIAGCSSEPKTFEDCLLKYTESGMNTTAVYQVRNACRAKFPSSAAPAAMEAAAPAP